jgi:hypothetical protein
VGAAHIAVEVRGGTRSGGGLRGLRGLHG